VGGRRILTTRKGNYVEGTKRNQDVLLPHTIDKYVDDENPVRFIDAFVDRLDLKKLGFKHAEPCDEGRPPYDPSDLLKLYVYGYLNQVRSSRKLERECHRNVEVLWLMKKLTPDFKTIADFRRENADRIKPVFREFLYLCRSLDLYGAELVAIDGSKFKAVNSEKRNLNEKLLAERLRRIEERIAAYLKEMEENDKADDQPDHGRIVERLKEKLDKLEEKREEYTRIQAEMKTTGQKQISLTDPDSRLMRVDRQKFDVCYNIESAVDSKHHLIVDYDATNNSDDHNQLARMAERAKKALDVSRLSVTADKGFYDGKELEECERNQIATYVPIPQESVSKSYGVPEPNFYPSRFIYDPLRDVYLCPAHHELSFWRYASHGKRKIRERTYRTGACVICEFRNRCTRNRRGRVIFRSEHQAVIDKLRARLNSEDGAGKLNRRRELAEHPFGTMKRAFNQGYLLLKGLRKVNGEVGFMMLAYNMRRALNIVGTTGLIGSI
jgi:transposase